MTTTVTFKLTTPGGGPVTGGKVIFTLGGFDLDGGIVMGGAVEATIAADGTGSAALWPNYAGVKATSYAVSIVPSGSPAVAAGSIVVPQSAVPLALHTLLPVATIGGLKAVVLTQAEYVALPERNAQTIYLIRAEV